MADAVATMPRPDDGPPMARGCVLIPAHDCVYPPAVEAVDVLRVDFDRRSIGPDGLYLVEELGASGVVWRGCRRFQWTIGGKLQIDLRGSGYWADIDVAARNLRVAGSVEQVYKPARTNRTEVCDA